MVSYWMDGGARFDVGVPDDPDKGCQHRSGPIYREKAHWKIVIGHARVNEVHFAGKSLMGCGSLDGANGMLIACGYHP